MNMKKTKKRTSIVAAIMAITFSVITLSTTATTVTTATTATTVTTATTSTNALVGDVNYDGIITGTDATLVLSYYTNCSSGKDEPNIDMLRADVDNNGIITASTLLYYYFIWGNY